jgi:hypothetical protein
VVNDLSPGPGCVPRRHAGENLQALAVSHAGHAGENLPALAVSHAGHAGENLQALAGPHAAGGSRGRSLNVVPPARTLGPGSV